METRALNSILVSTLSFILTGCYLQTTININYNNQIVNFKKMKKINKKHFKSKYTYEPPIGEINNSPSKTVQGEAYSIKELLERHTTGLMPQVGLDPQYDSDDPTHDDSMLFRKQMLDLTDIDDLKSHLKDTRAKIKAIQDQQKAENKKQKVSDHIDRSSTAKEGSKGSSAADESSDHSEH